jgi:hypothetical protein
MLLGVVSLFQLVGGVVAGKNLRQGIRGGWSFIVVINLLRGLGFGAISFFIGVVAFIIMGAPYLILVELFVFAAAILVAVLIPDWILETFNFQPLVPILFGGVFMVVGVVVFLALAGDSILPALLFLAAFGGSGGYLFVTSTLKALKS